MQWSTAAPTLDAAAVVAVEHPVHARVHMKPDSFGHVLRDTFQWLVDVPERFGVPHRNVQWLRWPSALERFACWQDAGPVVQHYYEWVSDVPSASFTHFVQQLAQDNPGTPVCPADVQAMLI